MDIEKTIQGLQRHVRALSVDIGERSVYTPVKLENAAVYIESFYRDLGLNIRRQPYRYGKLQVANIIADGISGARPKTNYLVGAHYDTIAGTPGADDNTSAVAVQLEVARVLWENIAGLPPDMAVKFVSFTLEEPPAFDTPAQGSRVYAEEAKKQNEKIDGMICLEMVGYTCGEPGCQDFPFPLKYLGYPDKGDFIGVVGNFKSRKLTGALVNAFRKNPDLPVEKLTVPLAGYLVPSIRLSDHASFWDAGYKAVMITDTSFFRNPHYHRPSDTMDKLDFRFMAELVKSLVIFFLDGQA